MRGVRVLQIPLFLLLVALAVYVWRTWRRGRRRMDQERAAADFARDRPKLEEDFRAAADVTGKPRGLRWKSCEFQDAILLARDRANHQLVGLAAVTIAFEAIAGGGMEEVEAVGNLRAGTAILTWNGRVWTTAGQAVFNLEPREVLERYRESLMPLGK
jgi:hypothetical protein